jgi:hypothetical protein
MVNNEELFKMMANKISSFLHSKPLRKGGNRNEGFRKENEMEVDHQKEMKPLR